MYGELTDKQTISQVEQNLDNHSMDHFEILLYKKSGPQTRKYLNIFIFFTIFAIFHQLLPTFTNFQEVSPRKEVGQKCSNFALFAPSCLAPKMAQKSFGQPAFRRLRMEEAREGLPVEQLDAGRPAESDELGQRRPHSARTA